MANIEVLKQRVEDAERRLHSVQSARERECEALMDMWEQIRAKFQEQEREIAGYRAKLAALQDVNVELTSMIDSVLGTIEGSVTRSMDRIVPDIAGMAKELLSSEPALRTGSVDVAGGGSDTDETAVPEPIMESEIEGDSADQQSLGSRRETVRSNEKEKSSWRVVDDDPGNRTMSIPDYDDDEVLELTEQAELDSADAGAGIRNLISRIERAVNKAAGANGEAVRTEKIDRELEEIEHLRNQLNGLRQRISAAGPAE